LTENWNSRTGHTRQTPSVIKAKGYQDQTIQAYTDGSKNERVVGSGVAIFVGKELAVHLKFELYNKCLNNQAEQLAIFKALEIRDY